MMSKYMRQHNVHPVASFTKHVRFFSLVDLCRVVTGRGGVAGAHQPFWFEDDWSEWQRFILWCWGYLNHYESMEALANNRPFIQPSAPGDVESRMFSLPSRKTQQ